MKPYTHTTSHWLPMETGPVSPCPYLDDRPSQLAFGVALPTAEQLDTLLGHGYRRLGFIFYLPQCPNGCRECRPIRVPVQRFEATRSQRRLLRRHANRYRVEQLAPRFDELHFDIYSRHALQVSEDNKPCSPRAYQTAFVDSAVDTHFFEFRVDGRVVGISVLDEGRHAVSSVYAFWDPDFAEYSPGTFSALWEIEWARQRGKTHYHLGYWIPGCPSMSYKNRFQPHEIYDWENKRWHPPLASGQ